jgi:hypothetical protein
MNTTGPDFQKCNDMKTLRRSTVGDIEIEDAICAEKE